MDRKLTTMGEVNQKFNIQGINHVALVCQDMQKTVDFYHGILGMPIIKTYEIGPNGKFGQHFFFDIGGGSLAFFWFPDAPAGISGITSVPSPMGQGKLTMTALGTMNHIALNVDADMLDEYREKLEAAGVECSPVIHHNDVAPSTGPNALQYVHETNWVSGFYFLDPNGIQIELAGFTRQFNETDVLSTPAKAEDAASWADKRETLTT
ncbi:VOC family protein [Sphingobium phenoxybenzoativorans]|uniref:VOC family protein n=1 Tax=Sphingobium phenoxybenzoativorans TaxID=1592790 RepID=A0A975K6M0_9SPHN|nr:VOC family protein [Sphingobium phenoxybenzoativorans]QUT05735.1 VOC family protein [Sphingobium phenoxybenzoativorans]